jgi:hypothetical protein
MPGTLFSQRLSLEVMLYITDIAAIARPFLPQPDIVEALMSAGIMDTSEYNISVTSASIPY